jgi:hypothetical protein
MKQRREKRFSFAMCVVAACVVAFLSLTSGEADDNSSPIFDVRIPAGYREWPVVSVAHEAGDVPDIRAILGNPIAMKALRDGALPFPDGSVIARVAWKYLPSAENNAVFGRAQSFVAGAPTNLQFMVKDSKKYAMGVCSVF